MCRICHIEFQTGDDFYLMDDKKLICKTDYENAKAKGNVWNFENLSATKKMIVVYSEKRFIL